MSGVRKITGSNPVWLVLYKEKNNLNINVSKWVNLVKIKTNE